MHGPIGTYIYTPMVPLRFRAESGTPQHKLSLRVLLYPILSLRATEI